MEEDPGGSWKNPPGPNPTSSCSRLHDSGAVGGPALTSVIG